jgi:Lon protease-like protein
MSTHTLPVFPLPHVLFPGAALPLHVFEPRYRQMLADCRDGDGRFGIAYVIPTPYTDPAPSPGAVGCSAVVERAEPLTDGRLNILVTGERRFLLRTYLETDRLYRVAVVEPFEDEAWDADDVGELAAAVSRDFASYLEALESMGVVPPRGVELAEQPAALSFQVAAALDIEPKVKQALLELRQPSHRLRRLGVILGELTRQARKESETRARAKGNGGGTPPTASELRE